jgi:DNA-binding transcriptional MerR regulator
MQIKEFSQLSNLPAKTIRYYEDIGLLPPPQRLENSYRVYDQVDLQRARLVAGARSLGLPLADIQEILALRDRREAPCRVLLDLLEEKASEIGRRITELQHMETELRDLHRLGQTFPTDDIEGKDCVCHLVAIKGEKSNGK